MTPRDDSVTLQGGEVEEARVADGAPFVVVARGERVVQVRGHFLGVVEALGAGGPEAGEGGCGGDEQGGL